MAQTKGNLKSTKRLSLSIGVWNVNGLASKEYDKMNDTLFVKYFSNLEIVGLVETHTTSSFMSPLNDYKIYHTHRVQNSRAKRMVALVYLLGNLCQMVLKHSQPKCVIYM